MQSLELNMDLYGSQFVASLLLIKFDLSWDKTLSSLSSSVRPERPSNVVGKPKGQGQTQETAQDRRKKEANKSRVSNHNRRTMADRKRNKGMIPSWPAQPQPAAWNGRVMFTEGGKTMTIVLCGRWISRDALFHILIVLYQELIQHFVKMLTFCSDIAKYTK